MPFSPSWTCKTKSDEFHSCAQHKAKRERERERDHWVWCEEVHFAVSSWRQLCVRIEAFEPLGISVLCFSSFIMQESNYRGIEEGGKISEALLMQRRITFKYCITSSSLSKDFCRALSADAVGNFKAYNCCITLEITWKQNSVARLQIPTTIPRQTFPAIFSPFWQGNKTKS